MSDPVSTNKLTLNRRGFVRGLVASGALSVLPRSASAAVPPDQRRPTICAFIKYLQSLSYDEMAERVAEIGFDGIESTVRKGGHVLPERVKDDLPRQLEAVRRAGMDITIVTSDVLDIDQPYADDVLRTTAELGLKKYRMGFYRYDKKRGVMEQLQEIRSKVQRLAEVNRELGLTAVYQNHCGANFVGAPIWDLNYLLDGISARDIGVAFDLRHATVEGGLSWPLQYDIIEPRVGALFVKDFDWRGKKAEHVPLGQGRVDLSFYEAHRHAGPDMPLSLHVEYLKKGGIDKNIAALKRDYGTLCEALGV